MNEKQTAIYSATFFLSIVGIFNIAVEKSSDLTVCSAHRNCLGIYWKGRIQSCQVPGSLAVHKKGNVKADRSVNKELSKNIKMRTGQLLAVGSCKYHLVV